MAMSFTHETLGQRVRFGRGQVAVHVRAEVERLAATLGDEIPVALRWSEVRQHVPLENAERARDAARDPASTSSWQSAGDRPWGSPRPSR